MAQPNHCLCGEARKKGSLDFSGWLSVQLPGIAIAVCTHFGPDIEAILRRLNATGYLFPYLQSVRSGDRATEFKQRCEGLGIKGVTLHSYRYAWAERAKTCGYPERFAQEALGHNSKAVHRSYSRKAKVRLPSLQSMSSALRLAMSV